MCGNWTKINLWKTNETFWDFSCSKFSLDPPRKLILSGLQSFQNDVRFFWDFEDIYKTLNTHNLHSDTFNTHKLWISHMTSHENNPQNIFTLSQPHRFHVVHFIFHTAARHVISCNRGIFFSCKTLVEQTEMNFKSSLLNFYSLIVFFSFG